MQERIKKGLEFTRQAIEKGDAALLSRCIVQLLKLKASPEDLETTLKDCPVGLLVKTGCAVVVFSELLQREIVLGRDIAWDALADLIERRPAASEVVLMFEAAATPPVPQSEEMSEERQQLALM